MNIYDCFMYYDEDLILDIRLNILNKYVKKFVITEATYTHKGDKRKLNFKIDNFKKFKDKIEYIVVDEIPENIEPVYKGDQIDLKNRKIINNAIKREHLQREMLNIGINKADENDLIIISDLDEIPNLENFNQIGKLNFFEQKMFYYKFNLRFIEKIWIGSRACKKKNLISPNWLRHLKFKKYPFWRIDTFFSKKKYRNINFIKNGGWHFTNIKTAEEIHFKLSNFMHHLEYEYSGLKKNDIKEMINSRRIYYDHFADKKENKWKKSTLLKKVKDDDLPNYITENKIKYMDWFDLND